MSRSGSSYFFNSFFSHESGVGTRLFYFVLLGVTLIYSFIAVISPLVIPHCDIPVETKQHRIGATDSQPLRRQLIQGLEGGLEKAPNPSFAPDPCRWDRYWVLLGMNTWEADMSRRIVMSIIMGSIIGFERRRADRPAGIRTMAMVCLGSCVFTLGSMFAFIDGTMGWDASRVSAAIPSGVGFLGAASIWKGTKSSDDGMHQVPEVHGLTTATSVWLSAAIGILCGGGLFVPGLFTTGVGVVYMRFAPRLNVTTDDETAEQTDIETSAPSLLEPLNPKAHDQRRNSGSSERLSNGPNGSNMTSPCTPGTSHTRQSKKPGPSIHA